MSYKLFPKSDYKGTINNMPSLTVPDQTMSIRTILEKYARGESFNQKVPIYSEDDGENMGIDIRRLDISEIAELKKQNDAEIKRMQDELGQKRADKAAKQRDEEIQLAAKLLMEKNDKGSEKTIGSNEPI